jgi:L-alanine-DL-glutamate epimerase-like enolase superfamily enzyme
MSASSAADATPIARITLRVLKLPLFQPYRLSYRTFDEFEPIIAEILLEDGHVGWGEGHISPGSSKETREGGWAFCTGWAQRLRGKPAGNALACLHAAATESPVAAGALACAIEMATGDILLHPPAALACRLLTPINATRLADVAPEVETLLAEGFNVFKVKVGKSVEDDQARLRAIQQACGGRATLRVDANRAFDRASAVRFVGGIDPTGIELFEQPCATAAWDDNAAVAAACPVPLMLDEPICSLADIDRAATIGNVGFCKVKLKRFSGLRRLRAALESIRAHGMKAVLGDGLSTDLTAWMEACVGAGLIHGAGEFNGFLKIHTKLLTPPLQFANGTLHVPPGLAPRIEWDTLREAITHTQIV